MRSENVEIYSDATNAAVIRHPARRFPGVLIQGDTLHGMLQTATLALEGLPPELPGEARVELADLHEHLASLVSHYKKTLVEHGISLPFDE